MTIRITLDAPALRALIADDAEFAVDIKRAVIGQVLKDWTFKSVEKELRTAIGEVQGIANQAARETLRKEIGEEDWVWGTRNFKLTKKAAAEIKGRAQEEVRSGFRETYNEAIDAAKAEAIAKLLARVQDGQTLEQKLEDVISGRVSQWIEQEVRNRVDARVKEIFAEAAVAAANKTQGK